MSSHLVSATNRQALVAGNSEPAAQDGLLWVQVHMHEHQTQDSRNLLPSTQRHTCCSGAALGSWKQCGQRGIDLNGVAQRGASAVHLQRAHLCKTD